MQLFEIHIGTAYNLDTKMYEPVQTILITQDQFDIITLFAETKKQPDLTTIYKINEIEFKIAHLLKKDVKKR